MERDRAKLTALNLFQRLVRQWDRVHPYNAAQVLRIDGDADVPRLEAAWQDALATLGLGKVHCDGRQFHFEPVNGDAALYRVARLPPGTTLEHHVAAELNRPFHEGIDLPLRPFVIDGQ